MDWIVIGAIVLAGWAMLSVLSGQRMSQAQRLAIALAHAAAEQARLARENEIPVAAASEGPLTASTAALNRKR